MLQVVEFIFIILTRYLLLVDGVKRFIFIIMKFTTMENTDL